MANTGRNAILSLAIKQAPCVGFIPMCHVILLLPIIGLPLFWLVPLPVASTVYALVVIFSAWVYHRLMKGMHQPASTGREAMLHASGEVLRLEHKHLLVRILGEIWQAQSSEPLSPGDPVEVVGVDGLQLSVKRRDDWSGTKVSE